MLTVLTAFVMVITAILCIGTSYGVIAILCMIPVEIFLLVFQHRYSYDNLMYRFGQMQYATIREMLFFIDDDMPEYASKIATEFNTKIQNISKIAHIFTSDDSTFIVEMYKLNPDTIPIVIDVNKKDLDKLIKKEDGIADDKARNSEFLKLTKLIKETMKKGE